MTLKDIEYFLAVAEHKNITKAASELFIAQPALSQSIKKLEKEIGATLFLRSKTGAELTKEGECFLFFAQKVIQEKNTLDDQISQMKLGEGHNTKLGFSGTLAGVILPKILQEYSRQYPDSKIQLVEAWGIEAEEKLIAKKIDVAILPEPVLSHELDYQEFCRDEMVLLPSLNSRYKEFVYTISEEEGGARDYISMEFFKTEPLITTFPGQRTRIIADRIINRAGITPIISLMARNTATVKSLAEMNIGSAILPMSMIGKASNRPFFRIPPRFGEPYIYVVATQKNAYVAPATQRLIDVILSLKSVL